MKLILLLLATIGLATAQIPGFGGCPDFDSQPDFDMNKVGNYKLRDKNLFSKSYFHKYRYTI